MKAITALTGVGLCAALALIPSDLAAQRGGRGGGGFAGARPGGYGGGVPMQRPAPAAVRPNPVQSGAVHGPYGGTMTGQRQTGTVTGRYGGSGTVGRQAGTYTGPHGGTGATAARGGSYTTGGGTTVTGGSRGNVYTGPHGTTVISGGKAGTVTGPGGNTIGGAKGGAVVIGPNGNVHATGGKAVAATGPNGTAVAGRHGSVTTGPGGTVVSGGRGAAAVGPNGVVAGGSRGVVATGPGGTYYRGTRYVGASTLHGQGAFVRSSFHYYHAFNPAWYHRYPGAWFAAGFAAGAVWSAPAWGTCAGYVGYAESAPPYVYDYGDNVTYQDGSVYYGDQVACTEQQYADQAEQIAAVGQPDPGANAAWQPLGVFAMVKGDETTSNDIFQIAMDKNGIIRGNYYNAVSDNATPITGSLDKKSQRIAWTIGDKKLPVYEAGLYNLTQNDTTMLVHFDKDHTEQYRLFRIEQEQK